MTLPTGTVTILMADVAGSTRLWEEQPAEMAAALARLDRVVDKAVEAHSGARPLEQGEGDSFVAGFSRASDALGASLDIARALDGGILRLRMAVHTGEVPLRDDNNYAGPAMNRAARVRELGHGGQILVSAAAAGLVVDRLPDGVVLRDLGVHRLRDLGQPEHVYQLDGPGLDGRFPPLRSLDHAPNNLPVQLTSFVGREVEQAELIALVQRARIVTLCGSGGCGKTRLALQTGAAVLDRFPGGVWFCDLSAVVEPDAVASTVADALALRDVPGASPADVVTRHLSGARALVVMDNCEHVIDAVALLVDQLLKECPQLSVLATSREPLGVEGETAWRVPSLGDREARQLFVERARAGRPNFSATADNADAIAEICARLDGIPLAIELAAARVRVLTPAQIAAGLADRFRLLGRGARTAMPRQQTLLASVGWSHDLLTDDQRVLFRRLAVFPATFDLDAAEAVGAAGPIAAIDVLDLLAQLVDRSLVVVDEPAGAARYRMLETIRQYGGDRLVDSGEAAETQSRHLRHFVAAVHAMAAGVEQDQVGVLRAIDRDHDNIQAAFDWSLAAGEVESGLRLAGALWGYWTIRGRYSEGRRWAEALCSAPGADDMEPGVLGSALFSLATCASMQADFAASIGPGQRALELARQAGARRLEARCLVRLGYDLAAIDVARGRPLLEQGAEVAREVGDQLNLAMCCMFLGWYTYMVDGPATAHPLLDEAIAIAGAVGDVVASADALAVRSYAHTYLGSLGPAVDDATAALAILDRTADPYWTAIACAGLGEARLSMGDVAGALAAADRSTEAAEVVRASFAPMAGWAVRAQAAIMSGLAEACAWAEEAARLSDRYGPWMGPCFRVWNLAMVARARAAAGDGAGARAAVDEALAIDIVGRHHRCAPLLVGAVFARADGDPQRAEAMAHEALVLASTAGMRALLPDLIEVLAGLDVDQGDDVVAARLLGAAAGLRANAGAVAGRWVEGAASEDGQTARVRLGDEAFDVAWQEGARLSGDDVVAYVSRGRGERKRPSSGWASLTPAEQSVVELVAEGLSNKDIGERLFVSRRTVDTHLGHVYAKLGLSSRTELVAEVVRRGGRRDR